MYNGAFDKNEFDWSDRPLPGTSNTRAVTSEPPVEKTLAAVGEPLFKLNCATCHQETGLGVAGIFPPLVKSQFVDGSPKRLATLILKGLQGPVSVAGVQYPGVGVMPAWEQPLNDQKIASILSYIRQAWGNHDGEIAPEQVAAARKEFIGQTDPWKESDLLKLPAAP